MKDFYRTLEVAVDATQDEIREQYHFLLHAWHPDKFSTPEQKAKAQVRTKEINEAYETLRDPQKRMTYDRENKQTRERDVTVRSSEAISKAVTTSRAMLSREESVAWSSRLVRLGLGTPSLDLIQKINFQIPKWNFPVLYESDEVGIFGSRVSIGTTPKNLFKAMFLDQSKPEVWAVRVLNPAGEVIRGTWEGFLLVTNKRMISYSSGSKDEQQGVKIYAPLDDLLQMQIEESTFAFIARNNNRIEIGFNFPKASLGTIWESDDDDYSRRKPDIARERQRALEDAAVDLRSSLFALFNEICVRARALR